MIESLMFTFLASLVLLTRVPFMMRQLKKFKQMFRNQSWSWNFLLILCFSIYILFHDKERENVKEATKKAIIAFIIAIFSELHLTIAPFWLVFLVSYFFEGWI